MQIKRARKGRWAQFYQYCSTPYIKQKQYFFYKNAFQSWLIGSRAWRCRSASTAAAPRSRGRQSSSFSTRGSLQRSQEPRQYKLRQRIFIWTDGKCYTRRDITSPRPRRPGGDRSKNHTSHSRISFISIFFIIFLDFYVSINLALKYGNNFEFASIFSSGYKSL